MSEQGQIQRRRLNLRLLEIFAAVVHEDGMTGAAATLSLTQSAVSQAIANLEASVGARLIDRRARPLRLTRLGDIIYRRTVEILDRVGELDRAVELHLHDSLPVLNLGIVNSVACTAGPHLVRRLDKLAARWIFRSGYNETGLRSLVERKVDFIISSHDGPNDPDVAAIPIFEEPFILVLPPSLKDERSIEALAAASPLIRYGSQTLMGSTIEGYFQQIGVAPPSHCHVDSTDPALAMVEEELGWMVTTPLCILKARMNAARIHCAPLPQGALGRRISLFARASESDGVGEQIAASTAGALVEQCLPRLKLIAPWADFRAFR